MAKKGIWTGIVEGLPIQPFNKMEDLQWQMDAEVLKTGGAQAFVNRMNTWGPTQAMKIFNKGYQKKYYLSDVFPHLETFAILIYPLKLNMYMF